MTVNVAD